MTMDQVVAHPWLALPNGTSFLTGEEDLSSSTTTTTTTIYEDNNVPASLVNFIALGVAGGDGNSSTTTTRGSSRHLSIGGHNDTLKKTRPGKWW